MIQKRDKKKIKAELEKKELKEKKILPKIKQRPTTIVLKKAPGITVNKN